MHKHYDVLIVGGGIVGLSLALALQHDGLNIAVLEKTAFSAPVPGVEYDLRVFAINRASQHFLRQLGVWSMIAADRISPYLKMQVWDSTQRGSIQFCCQDVGEPDLGHIIEQRVIIQALLHQLKQGTQVTLIHPMTLVNVEESEQGFICQGEDGERFVATLLVGADGANSWLRERLNMPVDKRTYGQQAIIATVKTEKPHQQTAWQRLDPRGPLAFLPLASPDVSSIVWSADEALACELHSLNQADFMGRLTRASKQCLGEVLTCSERGFFPLVRRQAGTYVLPGLALVGDAAHTIHPLAGQGVNLGLSDAKVLAEVIISAKDKGRYFAAIHTLRRYERVRRTHLDNRLILMDGFRALFTEPYPLLQWLGNMSLNVVDRCTPLKRFFIREAMGT